MKTPYLVYETIFLIKRRRLYRLFIATQIGDLSRGQIHTDDASDCNGQ